MARVHGTAGKTLQQRLLLIAGLILGAGFVTWLLLRLVHPLVAPLAPMLGLLVIARLLSQKTIENELVARGRGYLGEAAVGQILNQLPSGWRVFHDVDLGGENADHVLVSSRGVFVLEVKNYRGRVKAAPGGLYISGRRNDKVVRQAHRQAHKLRELLRVEVHAALVFAGSEPLGDRVGTLPVLSPEGVLPYLGSFTERVLEFENAREVFAKLQRSTR